LINFDYWFIFPLALLGAIVANATGAGGGVVFVPAFHMLGIEKPAIIATSFAIQCFGMTAGTIAWWRLAKQQIALPQAKQNYLWRQYPDLIRRLAWPSITGVLLGQYLLKPDSVDQVTLAFKVFSFAFGLAILATTYLIWSERKQNVKARKPDSSFYLVASFVSLVGGIITAWLSVGVGELIAVMLILMRFPVRLAIGVAVSVSAISVWIGVQYYLWIEPLINSQILLFAAPAAIIGGTVAKYVVSFFSPIQLKIFIAVWILISAVAM